MEKKWTEKHRREGMARALELFAALARVEGRDALDKLDEEVEDAGLESAWRPRSILSYALRLTVAGMKRERRRIDALAEGRLVRETVFDVVSPAGHHEERRETRQQAADACVVYKQGYRVVRITRIRRVPS